MASWRLLSNKRLQLAPTQTFLLAAQVRAPLARAAVPRAQISRRDFSVVGAAEAQYVGGPLAARPWYFSQRTKYGLDLGPDGRVIAGYHHDHA